MYLSFHIIYEGGRFLSITIGIDLGSSIDCFVDKKTKLFQDNIVVKRKDSESLLLHGRAGSGKSGLLISMIKRYFIEESYKNQIILDNDDYAFKDPETFAQEMHDDLLSKQKSFRISDLFALGADSPFLHSFDYFNKSPRGPNSHNTGTHKENESEDYISIFSDYISSFIKDDISKKKEITKAIIRKLCRKIYNSLMSGRQHISFLNLFKKRFITDILILKYIRTTFVYEAFPGL